MVDLSKRQNESLMELARWRGPYWHCRTSMRQMQAMGLVEGVPDPHSGRVSVNGPWRLTKAGREVLQAQTAGG